MARYDARFELREDRREDGERDGLDRFAIFFAMVPLDSPNEAGDNGRFTGSEGEIGVSVEGANGGEVGLDSLGLDTTGNSAWKSGPVRFFVFF